MGEKQPINNDQNLLVENEIQNSQLKNNSSSSHSSSPISHSSDIPESKFSVEKWIANIVQLLGNLSNISNFINEKTSNDKLFSDIEEALMNTMVMIKECFVFQKTLLNETTSISESDIESIGSFLLIYKTLMKRIDETRIIFLDYLDLLDLPHYSYCPACKILEKSLEFTLCEQCECQLIKGIAIREYFLNEFLNSDLSLSPEIIQTLHQKFKARVQEIQFERNKVLETRQFIDIPAELNLASGKVYAFFTLDETKNILLTSKGAIKENLDNSSINPSAKNGIPSSLNPLDGKMIETCKNCGNRMKFIRTTTYYDTNCELYRCADCNMEKMTNFQPIWESQSKEISDSKDHRNNDEFEEVDK